MNSVPSAAPVPAAAGVASAATKAAMVGGAAFQKSFQEWRLSNSNLYSAVAFLLLSVTALFSAEIPPVLRAQANTLLGRALLAVFLYVVYDLGGWTLACVALVAIALVIAPTRDVLPDKATLEAVTHKVEGFSADVVASREIDNEKPRWFVERVLKERPQRIEEDRVLTQGNSS
jgi:hypothetical protein